MLTADQAIEILALQPLPGEDGWFRETLRTTQTIPAGALPDHPGPRTHCTQIYFLIRAGEASALHRVRSPEIFHHYHGSPVTQLQIDADDRARVVTIGPDLPAGQRPQVVVPAHAWQGAVLADDTPDAFALLGCTVSPGFEWEDFELATPEQCDELARTHPDHAALVEALKPRAA